MSNLEWENSALDVADVIREMMQRTDAKVEIADAITEVCEKLGLENIEVRDFLSMFGKASKHKLFTYSFSGNKKWIIGVKEQDGEKFVKTNAPAPKNTPKAIPEPVRAKVAKKTSTKEPPKNEYGEYEYLMDYIPDKDLFQAVMFARSLIKQGKTCDRAYRIASNYYDVRYGDVSHYVAQVGARVQANRRIRKNR